MYVVSERKFHTLYFTTVGYYGVYWWYRNWMLQRDVERVDCIPVLRAIFAIFFAHAFLRRVAVGLRSPSLVLGAAPATLATVYVIASIAQNLGVRLPIAGGTALILFAGTLATTGLVLGRVQRGVNVACADSEGASNDLFSGANIAWIVVGLLVSALTIVGLMLGDE